ncbi:hypothetical protein O6H91_19G047600 [Diphasiastrum complanatum]|uniref:Uncharacterized protein n=1 Tax=Diphasiastrum complanatum TaxID=34168 RepID=A0ACC2AUT4_DIPCM|nr:hypothetical protein O6H91_19G047600 [Diphasiastrum complanatum]
MASDSALKKLSSSQHRRTGLLKHQLHLVKRKDCDRYEIAPIPDQLSFDKGFFLFIRACQLLTQHMEDVVLVGLAGPSGAGKTVFSEKVRNFLPGVACISMDNYNDSTRVIDGNYDDPRIIDFDTLLGNISNLKQGKPVEVPMYDFKLSRRTGYRMLEVPPSRIVIVEGTYALSERLRPLLDLRVSITGGVHFDLVKRVLRDINRSGQAPEDIIHQISETVYPMYKVFIEPDLQTAHIKIVNKFNPFSGFQNPTYILKSGRLVCEDQIRSVLAPDHTQTMEETYDIYLLPPGEDPEACQSYLRMRNRDGKYSLMFEEWFTDGPFIISPRITFEVSVRLLGGLMALGYEMAAILKRNSHVFADEKLVVKIDKLEQVEQRYVQVQGKDRSLVAEAAKNLGLEGSFIPRSYIEQIQLEKLTAEALPDNLKTDLVSSPLPSLSWLSDVKPGVSNHYSKSWTNSSRKDLKLSLPSPRNSDQIHQKDVKSQPPWRETKNFDWSVDSPGSDQLSGLHERLDMLLSRLGGLESRLAAITQTTTLQGQSSTAPNANVGLQLESCSEHGGSSQLNGNATINGPTIPSVSSASSLVQESALVEEVTLLSRGQRHIHSQLDMLNKCVRECLSPPLQPKKHEKGVLGSLICNMKTTESGLATAAFATTLLFGSVAAVIAASFLRKRT